MERRNRSSMGDVLIHLMDQVGETWNKPLDSESALSRPQRFFYAFAGAFPWIFFNMDRDWNILRSLPESGAAIALAVMVYASIGAWFAWLIAYQGRNCSPSRFFLEGLLFPGVATALLTSSQSLFGLFGGGS